MKWSGTTVRFFLILALPLICIMTFSGCTHTGDNASHAPSSSAKILKIGVTPNSPPLIYRKNGNLTGLEAEFARELAAYTEREIHFVEVDWEDQIPSLVEGRTDIIMSGMSITELRKYRIEFTDPYLVSGQVSLVRRSDFRRFSNGMTDLLNLKVRIGTISATTGNYFVQQRFRGNETKEFSTPQQAINALLDNRIDAFVYDLPMNFYFGALYEAKGLVPVPVPLTREYLAWGVRKDDSELLALADHYLENLKQSGRLQEKIQRWIPFYRNIYNQ